MMTSLAAKLRLEELEPRWVMSLFFVAPTGDDGADGSWRNPWRTLQHAADQVQSGDGVVVWPGEYTGFHLSTSGTPEAPVVFSAHPGATIVSPEPDLGRDGINLENYAEPIHDVVVHGFTILGMPRAGIRAVGIPDYHANNIAILSNKADLNGSWGIFTSFVDHLYIEGNETSRSIRQHGIYVSNTSYWPVVRSNVSWGNRANGIHFNGDASQGDVGIIKWAWVEKNIIYENGIGGGSGINADGVQNSLFQNNLLVHNFASGISLYQIDAADGSRNNLVINNTIVVAWNGRWAININTNSTGNSIYNNILLSYHSYRGSITISEDSLPGFVSDYNVVMNRFTTDDGNSIMDLETWRNYTGQDWNSLVATPEEVFLDPNGGDFHLSSSSPAIGRGTWQYAPLEDLDGTSRPGSNGTWDIGAYEVPDTGPGVAYPSINVPPPLPGGTFLSIGERMKKPLMPVNYQNYEGIFIGGK